MINADMRFYEFLALGENDAYGQPTLSEEPKGSVKMAIYTTSTTVQDNVNYEDANYIGLTLSSLLDETCVVLYEGKKLKVQNVISDGRYNQVFMKKI